MLMLFVCSNESRPVMRIEILQQPFDPWSEVSRYQSSRQDLTGKVGATTVFVGSMRDFSEDRTVSSMTLEYYAGMTEKHLQQIAEQAMQRFEIDDVMVLHRVGEVKPGDPIVCVAVWSAHRKAAYEANRLIMEDLKSRAPFWKKEQSSQGEHWVERNTPG